MAVSDPVELVVSRSRRSGLMVLLGCLAFSCFGVWLLTRGDRDWSTWLGLAFFGGFGIPAALYQLRDRRPQLVLNRDGIMKPNLRIGVIAWNEIIAADLRSMVVVGEFIALRLRNPGVILDRMRPSQRTFAVFQRSFTGSDLSLSLSGLAVRGRDVLAFIRESCERAGQSRSTVEESE